MTSTSQQRELDRLVARILCGRTWDWTGSWNDEADDAFFARTSVHGVTALVAYQLRTTVAGSGCPTTLLAEAQQRARRIAARESVVAAELRRVLSALERRSVRPVIIKGTALAYTAYEQPHLRERCDTDLLIRVEDLPAVENELVALGYRRRLPLGDGATTPQAWFERQDRLISHAFDVHWHISNRPLLRDFVTYDELADRAEPAPRLHRWAIVPSAVDALLLAAVHRVAHHDNAVELGWLRDIHLLARELGVDGLQGLRERAETKGIGAVCASAMDVTVQAFDDSVALREWVADWRSDATERHETSQIYLTRAPWIGDQAITDFLTQPDWRARFRYTAEIMFPSAQYMTARYRVQSSRQLPLVYVQRLAAGAFKLAIRIVRDLGALMSMKVSHDDLV